VDEIMNELTALLASLFQANSLISLGVIAGCLLLAWAIVRLLRGNAPPNASVWFGDRIYDGVLFPATALVIAYAAKLTLAGTVSAAVFKLAIPMLISLLVIRLTVRILRASFPNSRWMRVFERSVSWMAWLAVLLWITGVLPLLLSEMEGIRWKVGASQVSLRDAVEALITGAMVMMLALWVAAAAEKQLLRGPVAGSTLGGDVGYTNSDLSVRKMVSNLVRAGLLFIGLLLTLSTVGIDLTALSVLGGAIGVGLGFGLQKIAANYISGFVILAERSLRIGDMVKVDNFDGRITDIRTRYTVIRALNGREAIVPNEMLITQRVENLSLADPRVLLTTTVQVAYGTDVRALQPLLEAAMVSVPRVLTDPGPSVQLSAFAADGMDLSLLFWIRDPENGQGNAKSDVNLAVLAVLNERGIEIPYPHRVVKVTQPEASLPRPPKACE
jgi:small-conductance mechanosensitive channel